jgi:hypothetical protein
MATTQEQSKPRRTAERQAALSMRIAPATRDEIVESAAMSGRSVTQEADRLLQMALMIRRMLDADLLSILLDFRAAGERHAEDHGLNEKWTENPDAYRAGAMAAIKRILEGAPGDWFEERGIWHTCLEQAFTSADGRYVQGLARRRNPK